MCVYLEVICCTPSVPLCVCVCVSETTAVIHIDRIPAAAVTRMSVCSGELHKYILESELILN